MLARPPAFRHGRTLLGALVLCAGAAPVLGATPASRCAALVGTEWPSARVVQAEARTARAFDPPSGRTIATPKPFCRAIVSARPSDDSDIRIEVWLPLEADWNGRLWGVGNSSWAGYIPYRAMSAPLAAGYVAVGTDTGHQAKSGDSSWARGHPQKVADYGHRGIHEAAVAGKRVAAAYYGRHTEHAYFSGCSSGGRFALMEAQRYPDDYDGILSGDPDYDSTLLYAGLMKLQARWMAEPARALLPAKIPAIHAAALKACDRADGVADGVIANPPSCRFDTAVLACKGAENDRCLTPPQLETLNDLYASTPIPALQRQFEGLAIGSEEDWDWFHLGAGGPGTSDGFQEAVGFYRDLVFNDAGWDASRFDPVRDNRLADQRLGPVLNANDPELGRFAARGGKLIVYQGWADPAVAAMSTINYYRRAVATVGEPAASDSLRLFMAPGMTHCGGGAGPDRFGQSPSPDANPRSSLAAALQRWVEHGVAPEQVIATKLADDDDVDSSVAQTRPLCAYPKLARYRGSGDTNDAASFECALPR